jgi:hypothetical protein
MLAETVLSSKNLGGGSPKGERSVLILGLCITVFLTLSDPPGLAFTPL